MNVSWENIVFEVEPIDSPPVTAFLKAFEKAYCNGGAVVRSFRMAKDSQFDHGLQNFTKSTDHIFRALLSNPTVVAALPELAIQVPLKPAPKFSLLSAFAIEGELTNLLVHGGAYEAFHGTVLQARKLTRSFMESIFGEKMQSVGLAGYSTTPWTSWFCDIAWDATFVLYQQKARRIVVICLTDTD